MGEDKVRSYDGQEQPVGERSGKAYRVELCFACAVFLAAAALFVLTGSSNAFLPAIVGGIWAAIIRVKMKKAAAESVQENIKRIMICLLAAALSQTIAPIFVGAGGAWRYPVIKGYVDSYNTTDIPEWLPDRIPSGAEDYRLEYMPSIMQGNGNFSVRFKCSGEELGKLESLGKEKARYILPLTDYIESGDSINVSGYAVSPAYEITSDDEMLQGTLSDVRYDRDFWQGYEDDAVMYVVFSSLNTRKAHSEVIIINMESGMVQLFAD